MPDFKNKSILITGGTGSLGTALCKRLLKQECKKIIVFSRDWQKQNELKEKLNDPPNMRWFIGDVRDLERLIMAFEMVDVVVHAAAIKCIDICEREPFEAKKTNIDGSENVILACLKRGVSKAILISTDKAVFPVNLYGLTKATAERLFIRANKLVGWKEIAFGVIRYGNVIGSNGSVVQKWRKCIESGEKELPLTDERMTRFWYRIEDAVEFILTSLDELKTGKGQIFIPNNIPSIYIKDLAKVFDMPYKIIGIRENEKLHEALDDGRTSDQNTRFLTVDEIRESLI
ncbi:MAG: SDR family NAD(P)-dependent oxidoreductase [Patescibacteria group bacterium]